MVPSYRVRHTSTSLMISCPSKLLIQCKVLKDLWTFVRDYYHEVQIKLLMCDFDPDHWSSQPRKDPDGSDPWFQQAGPGGGRSLHPRRPLCHPLSGQKAGPHRRRWCTRDWGGPSHDGVCTQLDGDGGVLLQCVCRGLGGHTIHPGGERRSELYLGGDRVEEQTCPWWEDSRD